MDLNIEAVDFKVKPRRLKTTWSNLTQAQLNIMMNLNSSEELVKYAGREMEIETLKYDICLKYGEEFLKKYLEYEKGDVSNITLKRYMMERLNEEI